MSWTAPSPARPERTVEEAPAGARSEAAAAPIAEVLVLNRDPEMRSFINRAMLTGNFSSTNVTTPAEARVCLRRGGVALVLVAVEESVGAELEEFLAEMRSSMAAVPVVAIAPRPAGELVREVMLRGVRDFLLDPLDSRELIRRLRDVLGAHPAVSVAPVARTAPSPPAAAEGSPEDRGRKAASGSPPDIISRNGRMQRMLEIADTIAPTDSTVLILGESGTGKEVLAKRIHHRSARGEQPFVEVNCGALPENLLESQLFGHEKGSFTGAVQRQVGLFEIADRGTIFLDEIGEMGLDMQVKLLRVLQNQEFRRIGGSQTLKVDVRVIAATNRDLKADVDSKRFRADLYYRLNVIALEVPPLRDRLEDVPELIESFCSRMEREKGLPRRPFLPEAVERMQKCRWLGNVRELENSVERLLLLAQGGEVTASDVEEHLADDAPLDSPFAPTMTLDEVKRIHIAAVLKANTGNKMRTARLLGINVKTLYNLIKSLNIPVA